MNRLFVLSCTLGLALAGCVKSSDSATPRSSDSSGTASDPVGPRSSDASGTPAGPAAPRPADPAPPKAAPSSDTPGSPSGAPGSPSDAPGSASDSPGSPSGSDSSDSSGGGRVAKPGWCAQDQDCPGGQVCESCREGKCCVVGCHADGQCASGQRCHPVQCIRAPCPAQCE